MALLEVFGLKPWDVDRLNETQVRTLVQRIDDLEAEAARDRARAEAGA